MIKYGIAVAFLLDDAIAFGVVDEIVTRERGDTETKEFLVRGIDRDGNKQMITIANEENLADIGGWNAERRLLELARKSDAHAWATTESEKLLNPPEPPPPPVPAPSLDGDIKSP